MKILKVGSIFFALILVLFAFAIRYIDFNDYKEQIVAMINENSDYELIIKEDMRISLLPFGVKADDIVLKTKDKKDIVDAESIKVALEIMPLISQKYVINHIELDKPVVNLDFYVKDDDSPTLNLRISEVVIKDATIISKKHNLQINSLNAHIEDIDLVKQSLHVELDAKEIIIRDLFSSKKVKAKLSLSADDIFVEELKLQNPHVALKSLSSDKKSTTEIPKVKIASILIEDGYFESKKEGIWAKNIDAQLKDFDLAKMTMHAKMSAKELIYAELLQTKEASLEVQLLDGGEILIKKIKVDEPIINIDYHESNQTDSTSPSIKIKEAFVENGTVVGKDFSATKIAIQAQEVDFVKNLFNADIKIAELSYGEYLANNINATLNAKDSAVDIVALELNTFDTDISLSGRLEDKKVLFDVALKEFDLEPFANLYAPENKIKTKVDLDGNVSIDLDNLEDSLNVDLWVNSSNIELYVHDKEVLLSDATCNVKFDKNFLHVENIRANFLGSLVKSEFTYDFSNEIIGVDVNSVGLDSAKIQDRYMGTKLIDGYVDLKLNLNFNPTKPVDTISGNVNIYGKDMLLYGYNLDQMLEQYEDTQKVKLVDVGAFFLAGPLGVLATKGLDGLLVVDGLARGSSKINEISSIFDATNGEFVFKDVAFSTQKRRVAFNGGFSLPKDKYENLHFAIVDTNGCSRYENAINGKLNSPKIDGSKALISQVVNPITSIVTSTKDFLFKSDCKEPFYKGIVKDPLI